MNIQVTSKTEYKFGTDVVEAQFSDQSDKFRWRLIVNGEESEWYSYYEGILVFKNYGLVTHYWGGSLPVEKPFKIIELE